MNIFGRFKIRTKLVILVVFMLIGIIIVGGMGYYFDNSTRKELTDIYQDGMRPLGMVYEARIQSRAIKSNLMELFMSRDPEKRKVIIDDIATRKQSLSENISNYEKTTEMDDYEKEHMNTIKEKLAEWVTIIDKAVTASEAGNTDEIYRTYIQNDDKTFTALQNSLKELSLYVEKSGEAIYTKDEAESENALKILALIIVIIAVICIVLSVVITLSITKPVSKVVSLVNETARLNLVTDNSYTYLLSYKDEVGMIANAVENMRGALREIAGKIQGVSESLAGHSEELTASTEEYSKIINQVAVSINEIADGNNSQAEMVSRTNTKIYDVAQTIEKVNNITIMNAENAKKSLETIGFGQEAVDFATEKMKENVTTAGIVGDSINQLSGLINKVGGFTDAINNIAEQTNLLALNAAIEAARAGEAGKGFAVVSEEIRKLAEGSAAAAKEITQIVKTTIDESNATLVNMDKTRIIVENQSQAINNTREAFDRIRDSVEEITEKAQDTAVMLNDVDSISKEIANQTQDMAAVAEQSAAGAQEISASSEEQFSAIEAIAQSAGDLSVMAVELNNEISKFKLS